MQDYVYEAKVQQAGLKTKCSVKVIPDMIGEAKRIADKIISRGEFSDIKSGIHYEFSLEKGDESANMQIKSLFMYPSEETKLKIDALIKEISDAVQKEAGNGLEPILRQ